MLTNAEKCDKIIESARESADEKKDLENWTIQASLNETLIFLSDVLEKTNKGNFER